MFSTMAILVGNCLNINLGVCQRYNGSHVAYCAAYESIRHQRYCTTIDSHQLEERFIKNTLLLEPYHIGTENNHISA